MVGNEFSGRISQGISGRLNRDPLVARLPRYDFADRAFIAALGKNGNESRQIEPHGDQLAPFVSLIQLVLGEKLIQQDAFRQKTIERRREIIPLTTLLFQVPSEKDRRTWVTTQILKSELPAFPGKMPSQLVANIDTELIHRSQSPLPADSWQ